MLRFHAPRVLPLTLLLAGCGGGGTLLSTVPPPIDFAAGKVGGEVALPPAGAYRGTVRTDRVTYVYENGGWGQDSVEELTAETEATATIGADGTVALVRGATPLFSGTLVATPETESVRGSTKANLTAAGGTKEAGGVYALRSDALSIVTYGGANGTGRRLGFVRTTFNLVPAGE